MSFLQPLLATSGRGAQHPSRHAAPASVLVAAVVGVEEQAMPTGVTGLVQCSRPCLLTLATVLFEIMQPRAAEAGRTQHWVLWLHGVQRHFCCGPLCPAWALIMGAKVAKMVRCQNELELSAVWLEQGTPCSKHFRRLPDQGAWATHCVLPLSSVLTTMSVLKRMRTKEALLPRLAARNNEVAAHLGVECLRAD